MSELVPSEDWKGSHRLDPNMYFAEVYRLLSLVLASPAIATHYEKDSGRWFGIGWQEAEISRSLIHVASYYRVKYDDGSWEHAKWLHKDFRGVGELVDSRGRAQPLEFREACNKVIHALRIHFDGEPDTPEKLGSLTPIVHFYGSKGKQEWKAVLNVVEFCRAAANVIV